MQLESWPSDRTSSPPPDLGTPSLVAAPIYYAAPTIIEAIVPYRSSRIASDVLLASARGDGTSRVFAKRLLVATERGYRLRPRGGCSAEPAKLAGNSTRWCRRAAVSHAPPRRCRAARRVRPVRLAELLRSVFATDTFACACGGRRSVVAVVMDSAMALLAALRLLCTRRPSRLSGTRRKPNSGSMTLRSPHDRRLARQGRVCADVDPTNARRHSQHPIGARRLARFHLGQIEAFPGQRPNPACLSYRRGRAGCGSRR